MATFKFQNKYACAAYFNLARDNFHRTMMDVLKKIGIDKNYTETDLDAKLAEMLSVLKGNLTAMDNQDDVKKLMDQQTRLRQMLFRSFPILGPVSTEIIKKRHRERFKDAWEGLSEEEQEDINSTKDENEKRKKKDALVEDDGDREATCLDCFEAIYTIGSCLTDSRNFFTHYKPYNTQKKLQEMYDRQKQVSSWLSNVFTASRRLDKKRNKLSSAELEFITNHAFKIKTDEEGKNVKNEEGKDVFVQNHEFYFSILGESYIAKIEEDKYISKDYDVENIQFGNPENFALSDFGLLYLCCCFITRPQAQNFIKAIDLFANSPENITDTDYAEVLGLSRIPGLDEKRKNRLGILVKKLRLEKYNLRSEEDRAKVEALKNDITFNRQDTPENDIIREMLSIYRIRIPRGNRLDKQDNQTTVALDMLNELCRCPRPVYDVLTPRGQKAFEDIVDQETGGVPAKVDRIRYTDRFPYLALRAIDEANLLPDIRFQVQLGYYRFAFYDKLCIDGKSLLRRLGKTVNGFGKLSAIEARRKMDWSPEEEGDSQVANKLQRKEYAKTQLEDGKTELDLLRPVEDVVGNDPYITDSAAFYNIHNNRIGLYWEKKDEGNKLNNEAVLVFPTLSAVDNGGNGHRKAVVKDRQAPLCSLSVRDLPALLFLSYLYGHSGNIAENVIIKKYDSLKMFFEDLSRQPSEANKEPTLETIQNEISQKGLKTVLEKNYDGLKSSDIPERIKQYLDVEPSSPNNEDVDVVGYFKERLVGTRCELNSDANIDTIKRLVNQLGQKEYDERYSQIKPAKKRPEKTDEFIIDLGLKKILRFQGRHDEEIPKTIKAIMGDDYVTLEEKEENEKEKESSSDLLVSTLLDSLLGNNKDSNNPNIGRLERRIKQIDNQLKKLKDSKQVQFDKSNRYGTKSYKDVRYGRLAEMLAESMVKWQPTKNGGKDKMTSLNYRRLVDFLASYNPLSSIGEHTGIEALRTLLSHEGAGLIDSSNSHPFLSEVLAKNPKNIEVLFQIYMEQEKDKLLSIKKKLTGLKKGSTIEQIQVLAPAFVHPYRERWTIDTRNQEQIRQMAANYIKPGNTLLLPDGLFTDAIIQRLRNGYQTIIDEVEKNDKDGNLSRNVSYLISKFLEMQDDHCQSFYEAKDELFYRDYDLFSKLGEKPLSREQIAVKINGKDAKEALEKQISNKFQSEAKEGMARKIARVRKNEKEILRFKTQDIMLFLTAKKMLQKQQTAQDGTTNTDESIHRTNLGRQTSRAIDRRMAIQQERKGKVEKMRLQDIFDGDALNITMDYEYKYKLEWQVLDGQGNGVFKKGKKGSMIPVIARRIIYITQENVTFKNFGRIYRILNDPRLKILLALLVEKREGGRTKEVGPIYTVSVAELANEFAKFDSLRPQAFVLIHHLEKTAHPRLSNPKSDETYQFKNMMRLICEEQEADAVNQLRVSFAHSIYGIDADLFGSESTLQVPLVSELMEKQMQNRAEDIIKRTEG